MNAHEHGLTDGTHKVFPITGHKISSFIIDEDALRFSSRHCNSHAEFKEAWHKKLSLATKVEVKYETIRSIRKEDNDDDILINYKTFAGIPMDCEFSFIHKEDQEILFHYFTKKHFYQKTLETLTPFKATRNYLIGLAATIAFTAFAYSQAIALENGSATEPHSGKARLFNYVIGLLGNKGVVLAGAMLGSYLLYKIWTRFRNPPGQLRLVPPNR